MYHLFSSEINSHHGAERKHIMGKFFQVSNMTTWWKVVAIGAKSKVIGAACIFFFFFMWPLVWVAGGKEEGGAWWENFFCQRWFSHQYSIKKVHLTGDNR